MTNARRMWMRYEPVHAVTYFAPECRAATDALGMRGFWMGYCATRCAPLGEVSPEVATALFYNFHPDRARKAFPDAWALASAAQALQARLDGMDAAMRRLYGEAVSGPAMKEAADLARAAAEAANTAGRVLAAANQALPWPDAPHLVLWHATTILREHRGDGHNAVLLARQISPIAAHLLKAGSGESEGATLRVHRSWPQVDWAAEVDAMRSAGLLDEAGALTAAGTALHEEVEAATDAAAEQPWQTLGPTGTQRLAQLLTPLARTVFDSGTFPVPNPVGITNADL
jgi:hypothetical protein